jgi:hypothetical protein
MNFLAPQIRSTVFVIIWFHHDHLQYKTHSICEHKIPKILVVQSYTIPSQKMIYKIIFEQFLFSFLHGELRLILKRVFLCHGKQHWMNHFWKFQTLTN